MNRLMYEGNRPRIHNTENTAKKNFSVSIMSFENINGGPKETILDSKIGIDGSEINNAVQIAVNELNAKYPHLCEIEKPSTPKGTEFWDGIQVYVDIDTSILYVVYKTNLSNTDLDYHLVLSFIDKSVAQNRVPGFVTDSIMEQWSKYLISKPKDVVKHHREIIKSADGYVFIVVKLDKKYSDGGVRTIIIKSMASDDIASLLETYNNKYGELQGDDGYFNLTRFGFPPIQSYMKKLGIFIDRNDGSLMFCFISQKIKKLNNENTYPEILIPYVIKCFNENLKLAWYPDKTVSRIFRTKWGIKPPREGDKPINIHTNFDTIYGGQTAHGKAVDSDEIALRPRNRLFRRDNKIHKLRENTLQLTEEELRAIVLEGTKRALKVIREVDNPINTPNKYEEFCNDLREYMTPMENQYAESDKNNGSHIFADVSYDDDYGTDESYLLTCSFLKDDGKYFEFRGPSIYMAMEDWAPDPDEEDFTYQRKSGYKITDNWMISTGEWFKDYNERRRRNIHDSNKNATQQDVMQLIHDEMLLSDPRFALKVLCFVKKWQEMIDKLREKYGDFILYEERRMSRPERNNRRRFNGNN